MRTAILISGRGSNMRTLIAASRQPDSAAEIVLVISNRPEAAGIAFAEETGISTAVINHRTYGDREAFELALDHALREAGVDLVCLAGFMRILSPWFVERWRNRLLNIHPSLLPAFKGLHTHERALKAGVRIHGCSVHLVRPELDDGPILVQGAVPVHQGDTAESLAARVLEIEHRCYPLALDLVTSGRLTIHGDGVTIEGESSPLVTLINPAP